MLSQQVSCCFCEELDGLGPVDISASPLRRPLWTTRHLELLPSLGPLAPGHMLLLPKAHYLSFGQIPASLDQEVVKALQSGRDYLASRFGTPLCFEHGSAADLSGGGC